MGHMGNIPGHHQRHHASHGRARSVLFIVITIVVAIALAGGIWLVKGRAWSDRAQRASTEASASATAQGHQQEATPRSTDPSDDSSSVITDPVPEKQAKQMVESMSIDEQCAQLIMAPLEAGTDPSTLQSAIENTHIGSVILVGNWNGGMADVRKSTSALLSYAAKNQNMPVFIAVDQEGGQVQHLSGVGFSTIPSAYYQGRMSARELETSSQQWGEQLHTAGININLAPVVDTVLIDRASNAPIGALQRDYGLDGNGNADHALAFMSGMTTADVGTAVKHFPGLGGVKNNTDFEESDTIDTVTSANSASVQAFSKTIVDGKPAMVMVSLATYRNLDPDEPAVFSSHVITTMLRKQNDYDGIVVSDSVSASALQRYDPKEVGVRFVQAGGDIVCISDPAMTQPVLDGMVERAKSDDAFAQRVEESATRVLTQKYKMNLNQKN